MHTKKIRIPPLAFTQPLVILPSHPNMDKWTRSFVSVTAPTSLTIAKKKSFARSEPSLLAFSSIISLPRLMRTSILALTLCWTVPPIPPASSSAQFQNWCRLCPCITSCTSSSVLHAGPFNKIQFIFVRWLSLSFFHSHPGSSVLGTFLRFLAHAGHHLYCLLSIGHSSSLPPCFGCLRKIALATPKLLATKSNWHFPNFPSTLCCYFSLKSMFPFLSPFSPLPHEACSPSCTTSKNSTLYCILSFFNSFCSPLLFPMFRLFLQLPSLFFVMSPPFPSEDLGTFRVPFYPLVFVAALTPPPPRQWSRSQRHRKPTVLREAWHVESPSMQILISNRFVFIVVLTPHDNDNDTLREVPHTSNEGLTLQARVKGSWPHEKESVVLLKLALLEKC